MQGTSYRGPGRRKHLRLAYPPEFRPVLAADGQKLEVLDISEKGVCFLNPNNVRFAGVVAGRLSFLDGDSIAVAGHIAWEKDGCVGLHLIGRGIPYERFFKEQQAVAWLEKVSA